MLHLPILRQGLPYRSVEALPLRDLATGEPVAEVGQANAGLVARDLAAAPAARRALVAVPARERIAICERAGRLFAEAELPVGFDARPQGADEYVGLLSRTSGIPEALCRQNLDRLRSVLEGMAAVLAGLSRGLDPDALDAGPDGRGPGARFPEFVAVADALGAVLPSNSPGVHALWLPAIALGVPVFLKPGRQEPWTPLRLAAALAAAGCPPEALGFYPTDHAGAAEILLGAGRSLLFGDDSTIAPWRDDPRVQIHGPGRSKVILGPDALAGWDRDPALLDVVARSIVWNGGRSCLNASGVWLPAGGRGRELAAALARRLAAVEALPLDHPEARLAAFPSAAAARRVSDWIDRRLEVPGAEDLTAAFRGTPDRVREIGGCAFLLPTLVRCDPGHPLADVELSFPFASFVEVPAAELPGCLGPTLKATAITEDERLLADLAACRAIDHLNLGLVPTTRTAPDQPHEGNLFEHLYRRRALYRETAA